MIYKGLILIMLVFIPLMDFGQKMPDYQGGMDEFYKFMQLHLKYPSNARNRGTEGRVYVSFEIDSLKGIQNITTIQNISAKCAEEVVRVLGKVPNKWILKDKLVTFILPVSFRMGTIKMGLSGTDLELPRGKLLDEIIVSAQAPR